MRQETPRHQMPVNAAWNLIDYIPNLGAPLRKRGGWSYGSPDLSAILSSSTYIAAVAYARFSGGAQRLAISDNAKLALITSDSAASQVTGTAVVPAQVPILHSDKLIIPDSLGVTAPKYYDGTTLGALAGSPPIMKYMAVYKDRSLGGGLVAAANRTKTYFSGAADPTTWDTTNSWISTIGAPTGYAALPNALLIFQDAATSRVRGTTPPPGSDFIIDDPVFNIGCTDARSIVVNGPYCIFANPQGVFKSNGTSMPEDLTEQVGLKTYWKTLLATYDASTWTLSAGMIQSRYVISVMNGTTLIDTLIFNVPSQFAYRFANVKGAGYANAVTIGEELYFGLRNTPRVGRLSTAFVPTSAVKNDADGTAVAPILETPYFRDKPGKKSWKSLYATIDMRDAASDNPIQTVSYVKNPEDAYTALSATLAETTDMQRSRLYLRFNSIGIALKLAQTNASSDTRIYDLEADVHGREGSRL